MSNGLQWLAGVGGLILIGNFLVLQNYGYALRSTNLFIARSTVFYPLAWLNLLAGIVLLISLIVARVRRPPN